MTLVSPSIPFPQVCVSIDLETTGLSADNDRIIEVGAVKFHGRDVIETFQRLVNPGRSVPEFVTLLTSISDSDLEPAPRFEEIAEELSTFIGDLSIVGQNVRFDINFLNRAGLNPPGPVFDTLELSRLLRPSATSHSLGELVAELKISNDNPHRALADAEATMGVFLAFWDALLDLSAETLSAARMLALRAQGAWDVGTLIDWAAQARDVAPGGADGVVRLLLARLGRPSEETTRQRRLATETLGPAQMDAVFAAAGGVAKALGSSYEPRPQQTQMAVAVLDALRGANTLLLEAPPGTGKSLGYLIPAMAFADSEDEQVVIATSTRGLQEQLAFKDFPVAMQALGIKDESFRIAVLKGRGNYLCLSRLLSHLSRTDIGPEEAPFLVRVLVWLESTESGDLGELPMGEQEASRWATLSAGSETGHRGCQYEREGQCFVGRARRAAQSANLVIANHALLLADSGANGSVLGHIRHLILDEAHNLEKEATDHFRRRVTIQELSELLASLGGDSPDGRPRMTGMAVAEAQEQKAQARIAGIEAAAIEVGSAARNGKERADQFSRSLGTLVSRASSDRGSGDAGLRLGDRLRESEEWRDIAQMWEDMDASLSGLADAVDTRFRSAAQVGQGASIVTQAVDEAHRQIADLRARMAIVMGETKSERDITWIDHSRDARRGTSLNWAPMSVAPYLHSGALAGRDSVILTSATLTTDGSFGFISERLGLEEPSELRLSSPFGPEAASAALVPMDMPDPNSNSYAKAIQAAIVDVARAVGGGTLALFTSHASLRQTYTHVRTALQDDGIIVVGQGIDGPPDRLAEMARLNGSVVVLGAATFWEGIDLPGDALRALIVVRLPFDVPTDPIISARGEAYENSFSEFQIPRSLLRFRQGVGRLLRGASDRGVIVVLDSRVLSRAYGAAFIDALPTPTVLTPALDQLGEQVRDWFNPGD